MKKAIAADGVSVTHSNNDFQIDVLDLAGQIIQLGLHIGGGGRDIGAEFDVISTINRG